MILILLQECLIILQSPIRFVEVRPNENSSYCELCLSFFMNCILYHYTFKRQISLLFNIYKKKDYEIFI